MADEFPAARSRTGVPPEFFDLLERQQQQIQSLTGMVDSLTQRLASQGTANQRQEDDRSSRNVSQPVRQDYRPSHPQKPQSLRWGEEDAYMFMRFLPKWMKSTADLEMEARVRQYQKDKKAYRQWLEQQGKD